MASLDRVFDLLSNERRRYALYYLEQHNERVPVDKVAEQVATWQTDRGTDSIPEEKFEDVEVSLQHSDLPKAAKAEYVQYDPEEEVVEVTGTPPEICAIISVARTIERPERNP